jgi:hypothetical protein
VVDQNRNPAQGEILVIVPALVKAPAADAYVTVVGDLVAFDPTALPARLASYKLDVAPDVLAKFQGKPAIIATAVVASNLSDLTKKPPSPMSPEDTKLDALMLQISPAQAAPKLLEEDGGALGRSKKEDRVNFRDIDALVEQIDSKDRLDGAATKSSNRRGSLFSRRLRMQRHGGEPGRLEPICHEARVSDRYAKAERAHLRWRHDVPFDRRENSCRPFSIGEIGGLKFAHRVDAAVEV